MATSTSGFVGIFLWIHRWRSFGSSGESDLHHFQASVGTKLKHPLPKTLMIAHGGVNISQVQLLVLSWSILVEAIHLDLFVGVSDIRIWHGLRTPISAIHISTGQIMW